MIKESKEELEAEIADLSNEFESLQKKLVADQINDVFKQKVKFGCWLAALTVVAIIGSAIATVACKFDFAIFFWLLAGFVCLGILTILASFVVLSSVNAPIKSEMAVTHAKLEAAIKKLNDAAE